MVHDKWVIYGQELRRLRQLAGLTQRQLASRVKLSQAQIGALERAIRQPSKDYSDTLDTILNTGGVLSRIWHDVAGRRDVPNWFRDALTLERRASEIMEYESLVIPGLLQTETYARVLDSEGRLKPEPNEVERVVKNRTERLSAVLQGGGMPEFVISEVVLRYQVGGPSTMLEQLTEIAGLAESAKVLVQVLPLSAPSIALTYPFRVMALDRQTVAYVEHAGGGELIDDPQRVQALAAKFKRLQAEALAPGESVKLLRKLGDDLYGIQLES